MQKMIEEGKFVEHANVYGKYYGTSKQAVADVAKDGKICILDIDTQGARSMRAQQLDARYMFLAPPSLASLESRLRGRGTDKEEVINKRLEAASGELKASKEPGLFDQILVNDDLEKCYGEFARMMDEEIQRCRPH
jgi:guanylate kinase